LFQAGERAVVGTVGITAVGQTAEDRMSYRIEKLCRDESLKDRPCRLLLAIAEDVHEKLVVLFREETWRFRWLLGDDTEIVLAVFCCRRGPAGEIDLLELRLPLGVKNGSPVIGDPKIKMHMERFIPAGAVLYQLGGSDEMTRHRSKIPNPDSSDSVVLASADSFYEACATSEIGGPVDVAAIDSDGFRWLRRKTGRSGSERLTQCSR